MSAIFSIETKRGKHRGILSIYILHSIEKQPKTGYDLIAEIKEKTEGTWVPSKGTIYPLLKQLKEENLIVVQQIGERSKQIFKITSNGKKTLSNAKKHGQQFEENFLKLRGLFSEIAEFEHKDIIEHLVHIRMLSRLKSKKKTDEIKNILQHCEQQLRNL